jgi:hypothetical protein
MQTNPEKVNYNAFQEDNRDHRDDNNQNLKLSAEKSRFSKSKKVEPTEEDFKKEVQEFKKKEVEVRSKIAELTNRYKGAILDKTVSENKSPLQRDMESSIIQELANLGLRLDNDQDQPEGIGSIGLCNLLLQINVLQRDAINKLGYEISKLNRIVAKMPQLDDESDSK